jgi:predicted metalloprotease with PDZ domain
MTDDGRRTMIRHVTPLLVLLFIVPLAPAQDLHLLHTSAVSYTLSSPEPATHLYRVRMRVRDLPANRNHVDLVMPVWTPGSYLVREFARHVQDFTALPPREDAPAPRWEKIDKNTWRVYAPGRTLEVAYTVYANELSVRTSHLDDTHGYVNGANVFMYADGFRDVPATVRLEIPKTWDVATSLARAPGDGFVYHAPDYDTLVDSPIESGIFRRIDFEALRKPHTIAVWGTGNYDAARLAEDFKKIVETTAAVFGGGLPYDRYVFIVHLYPDADNGLEHKSSTTIEASPFAFRKRESYQAFLGLAAHEFFHVWNVKRIRPAALGPFDYEAENYTKMLWLMEGTTDYYASVILRRAGLTTQEEYDKELAKLIQAHESTPGRRHMSLEEASFDAWIKYYRRNEHSANSQVSYYQKGQLVSAILDLEIAGRTNGAKSLDDVMRYLWATYGAKDVGIPEDRIQPSVEAAIGGSFDDFFGKYVRGTAEIDYDAFLKHAGLRLVREVKKDDARLDPSKPGAWLGANVADANGRTVVRSVLEASPAWKGGLNAEDQLLALDGARVTAATLGDRLSDRSPGDEVTLTIFRRDDLRTLKIILGEPPPDTYKIEKLGK